MKKLSLISFTVLMLLPLIAQSGTSLIFGPEAFDRSQGSPNVYDESFSSTENKGFLLVFNGDDEEDSRVTSGSIVLNGQVVVDSSKLNQDTERITESVKLATDNTMQISLDGLEGVGYIIVMVVEDSKKIPEFTAGRIQLAWTSIADPNQSVFLRLKNGSPAFHRNFKVRFFNEDGTLAAISQKFQLQPHASQNSLLQSFLPQGSTWQSGSVEILFVGRGGGRILGFGVQSSVTAETAIPLQRGGLRHHFDEKKKK